MSRRSVGLFLLFTFLWYAATLITGIWGFSISMSTFDTGGSTSILGTILLGLSKIFAFPLLLLAPMLEAVRKVSLGMGVACRWDVYK